MMSIIHFRICEIVPLIRHCGARHMGLVCACEFMCVSVCVCTQSTCTYTEQNWALAVILIDLFDAKCYFLQFLSSEFDREQAMGQAISIGLAKRNGLLL